MNKEKSSNILQELVMQVLHQASVVDLEVHKQQVDAPNAQLILVQKPPGPAADAWELYPKREQSFVQTGAFALAQDNLVEWLHLALSVNSQSTREAPQTALAIWSEHPKFKLKILTFKTIYPSISQQKNFKLKNNNSPLETIYLPLSEGKHFLKNQQQMSQADEWAVR